MLHTGSVLHTNFTNSYYHSNHSCAMKYNFCKYSSWKNTAEQTSRVSWSSRETLMPVFSITILSSQSASNGSYSRRGTNMYLAQKKGLWQSPFCTSLGQLFSLLSDLTQLNQVRYDKCSVLLHWDIWCKYIYISGLGKDINVRTNI